jgi:hypothetical protein
MNEMKKNNIDVMQLVLYNTDHCQQAEPSTEKEVRLKALAK